MGSVRNVRKTFSLRTAVPLVRRVLLDNMLTQAQQRVPTTPSLVFAV
jgi:hypothetical protein